jgi:iron donor protein CyaY
MKEKDFLELSEQILINLADIIEDNDPNSVFDVEYSDGILNINIFNSEKTYVINKHSASKKIWFSSPVSGADYFSYDYKTAKWLNNNQQELSAILLNELNENFNLNYAK